MPRLVKSEPVYGFLCDCGLFNFGPKSRTVGICRGCGMYFQIFTEECPSCDPGLSHFGGCESPDCSCTQVQCVAERSQKEI